MTAQGMPREARRRDCGSGPSGLTSPVGSADAPTLLSQHPITTLSEMIANAERLSRDFDDKFEAMQRDFGGRR